MGTITVATCIWQWLLNLNVVFFCLLLSNREIRSSAMFPVIWYSVSCGLSLETVNWRREKTWVSSLEASPQFPCHQVQLHLLWTLRYAKQWKRHYLLPHYRKLVLVLIKVFEINANGRKNLLSNKGNYREGGGKISKWGKIMWLTQRNRICWDNRNKLTF